MKLKYTTIVRFCVIVIFILLSGMNGFYMVDVPGVTNYDFRFTFLIGAALAFGLLKSSPIGIGSMSRGFRRYCLAITLSIGLLAMYTYFTYPRQSLNLTLRVVSQYLLVFWAVPIYYLMKYDRTEYKIIEIVNLVSTVWCLLLLLQSGFYVATGSSLFSFVDSATSGIRDGNLRISSGCFANFSLLYCFWSIYSTNSKRKIYHTICMAVLLLSNLFVLQSRAHTAIIVVSMCVIVLLDENRGLKFIRKIIVVGGLIGAAFATNIVQTFLEDVFTRYEISVTARTYAYGYYWNVFKNNPLFGFGLLKDQVSYGNIYSGPMRLAFVDDVGFVGHMAILGVFSFVIILGCYKHLFSLYRSIRKVDKSQIILMASIMVYLLGTSFTLIIFDQARICLLPIIIAMFEYQAARYYIR